MRMTVTWMCGWLLLVGGLAAEDQAGEQQAAGLRFSRIPLFQDLNEGCDLADINQDGRLDIVAGRNWYASADLIPRPVRLLEDWNRYAQSCGEHALDVNGNGWIDVISIGFTTSEICWYENPGPEGLARGWLWERHVLVDTGQRQNEGSYLRDLNGDGTPELIINSWNPEAPLIAWQLDRDSGERPTMIRHELAPRGNTHGMGFGDINGNGREDILVGTGWFERPAEGPFSGHWKFHADWQIRHASCPMIVTDLDGDGRHDLIWGRGHDYGLYWWRQLEPAEDGSTRWEEHLIDDSWSQAHCLVWTDLDGDGQNELITGKRVYGHNGGDPGADDPPVLYYYKWDRQNERFTRYTIDQGHAGGGLQIRVGDVTGNGRPDVVVAGKGGTYLLVNEGF